MWISYQQAVVAVLVTVAATVGSFEHAVANDTLRTVTLNVARGIPMRMDKRYARNSKNRRMPLQNLLRRHKYLRGLDVLAAQEICANDANGWEFRYLQELFTKSGKPVHTHWAYSDPERPNKCGDSIAIFSRYPILDKGVIRLPELRPVGKVAIWVDLDVTLDDGGRQRVRVYNTHLDNRGKSRFAEGGRWKQAQVILEHILEWKRQNLEDPIILMGDLNSLGKLYNPWRREKSIRELSKHLRPSLTRYHPTHLLFYQLDWIFYDRLSLKHSKVVHVTFSDHFPVMADFALH